MGFQRWQFLPPVFWHVPMLPCVTQHCWEVTGCTLTGMMSAWPGLLSSLHSGERAGHCGPGLQDFHGDWSPAGSQNKKERKKKKPCLFPVFLGTKVVTWWSMHYQSPAHRRRTQGAGVTVTTAREGTEAGFAAGNAEPRFLT